TRIDPRAVDLDRAGGRHQIAVTPFAERVFDGLADLQRGAEHARAGTDRQRVVVVVEPARERHDAPGTIGVGERLRPPRRRAPLGARDDPDLENPGRLPFQVVFGVPDTGTGAHHLDVTGLGSALVAETVLVRHRALADVGDDLHVRVRVGRKAGIGGDLVIVPYPQRAPAHARGVGVLAEGKMVLGLQPAVVRACEL